MRSKIYFTKEFLIEIIKTLEHLESNDIKHVVSIIDVGNPNLNIRYHLCKDENHVRNIIKIKDLYSVQAVEKALNDDFMSMFLERIFKGQEDKEN